MNQWKVNTPSGNQVAEATELSITGNGDLVFRLLDLVALVFPAGAWTGCELVAAHDATNQNRWLAHAWITNRTKSGAIGAEPQNRALP
jgi:hypothetical protein